MGIPGRDEPRDALVLLVLAVSGGGA